MKPKIFNQLCIFTVCMTMSKPLSFLHVTGAYGRKVSLRSRVLFIRPSVVKMRGFVSALCVGLTGGTAHNFCYGTRDFLFGNSGCSTFTSLLCISLGKICEEETQVREMRHIILKKSILKDLPFSRVFRLREGHLTKFRLNCNKAV